ncbi:MAG TPA: LLM class flavin-dependent oxidoreductase [Ilumatobacteraceae bacterium]|jgi:alkanesulfonate monooxygenase SsuD/methylene tetrahydromethanopterin reductase-like flavin-dependent oxidoreductase (luciferase family)|nr:LLM class flavin-dependent oxidoreductase [Acidimicrobiaceae bacterium]HQY14320.1 LLM class flavin-dependent oxidoreductase [Ilumatobacteraceae bacterium]HQY85357.1 LLM class flavin-dependent oxidoreductase [Ilumatobacteraceae bacterium]HRC47839.1 LLM class flavin-dependent oxidoreductase [Ilumatobacteraceae bacterium]
MTPRMPALSLAAVPGRRAQALELAVEIERRGFSGIYCPSFGDAMGLCLSIAHATTHIEFGTSIQPIYLQHPIALATSASYLHEVAQGRFRLGIGVTHGPVVKRLGVETGKPLSDMREYVGTMRSAAEQMGGLPPVVLATLRDKMVGLAVEVGDGAVWANASRSRMAHSLALVPADRPAGDYWIGNMIPTVIDDDLAAARARNRKTLQGYVALPNYRNYWIEAGYEAEMAAVIAGLDARDGEAVLAAMSDRWLDDCTLSGPVGRVREGIEAWFDAGVTAPIVVPSSTSGGQAKAFSELFEAFA